MSDYPGIVVMTRSISLALEEVIAGIEEEGVMYEVFFDKSSLLDMASIAARKSKLHVGIAILDEAVAVIRDLNEDVVIDKGFDYRRIGHNSARYVKHHKLKGF